MLTGCSGDVFQALLYAGALGQRRTMGGAAGCRLCCRRCSGCCGVEFASVRHHTARRDCVFFAACPWTCRGWLSPRVILFVKVAASQSSREPGSVFASDVRVKGWVRDQVGGWFREDDLTELALTTPRHFPSKLRPLAGAVIVPSPSPMFPRLVPLPASVVATHRVLTPLGEYFLLQDGWWIKTRLATGETSFASEK